MLILIVFFKSLTLTHWLIYVLTWLKSFTSSQCLSRITTASLWPFLAARCRAVFPSSKLKCQRRYFKILNKLKVLRTLSVHFNICPASLLLISGRWKTHSMFQELSEGSLSSCMQLWPFWSRWLLMLWKQQCITRKEKKKGKKKERERKKKVSYTSNS